MRGMKDPSVRGLVQVPFACAVDDGRMTETAIRVPAQSVDSVAAERLWNALYQAQAVRTRRLVADLEDAAFRRYLSLARTLAHTEGGAQDADRTPSNRPPNSAWRTQSWPGGSGPVPGSAGSPAPASSGN